MVGPGDTGKSQLKSLVERLLGNGNYVGIDMKEIEARFGTSNLYGKRLAGSSDMSFLTVDELKTFKKCTGGDSLFAEFKGQNGFEFTYNGLLWFCMNRLPKLGL
jgi:phage/plasmid-associated DNA primase